MEIIGTLIPNAKTAGTWAPDVSDINDGDKEVIAAAEATFTKFCLLHNVSPCEAYSLTLSELKKNEVATVYITTEIGDVVTIMCARNEPSSVSIYTPIHGQMDCDLVTPLVELRAREFFVVEWRGYQFTLGPIKSLAEAVLESPKEGHLVRLKWLLLRFASRISKKFHRLPELDDSSQESSESSL